MASRTLNVVVAGDVKGLGRAMGQAEKDIGRLQRSTGRAGKDTTAFASVTSKGFSRVGVAARGMSFAGAGAAAILSKKFVTAASDINESLTKNVVLFGRYAKQVDDFSKTSAVAFGISRRAALEYTGVFGNLFRALGQSREQSAGFSIRLTRLAADMASFNNTSIKDALEAIRSGLVGETEPLRRFGVNMNDATLRTEALRQGIIKTTKGALTPQQRALAAQSLIIKQTANAHGDFKRTQGGLANQTRVLQARFEDLSASLGKLLTPTVTRAMRSMNRFVNEMQAGTGSGGKFASQMRDVGQVLGAVARAFLFVGKATIVAINGVRRFLKTGAIIGQAIGDSIRAIINMGTKLGEGLIRGIVRGIGKVPNAIKDALGGVIGGAKSLLGKIAGDVAEGFNDTASAFPLSRGPLAQGPAGAVGGLAPAGRAGLSQVQRLFGGVRVTSGRRSPTENARVGGAPNSDHLTGNALDLVPVQGWTPAGTALLDRIAAWAKRQANVRWIGWRGVPGHGPGDHLHLSFAGGGAPGARRGGRAVGDMPVGIARKGVGDEGSGRGRQIFRFFKGQGFTDAQAAAWVGNFQQESNLNPGAIQRGGPGRGLAQWGGGRFTALQAFARRRGKPWTDLSTQLAFVMYELRGSEAGAGRSIRGAKGLGPAVAAIGQKYERFGIEGNRMGPARAAYNAFKGSAGATGGAGRTAAAAKAYQAPFRATGIGRSIAGALGRNTAAQLGANADLDVAEAEASGNKMRQVGALSNQRKLVEARIRKIRRALKSSKSMRPAKRIELTQELSGLIGTSAGIGTQIKDLSAVDLSALEGYNADNSPTELDRLNLGLAEATLTPGTADDLAAATANRDYRANQLAFVRAGGDPRLIAEYIDAFKSADDSVKALTEATQAQEDAMKAHTDALKSVHDELKRQTDLAAAVQSTDAYQMKKMFADFVSGQFAGYGVARSFTPGAGREFAW